MSKMSLPCPAFIVDEHRLIRNLEVLAGVRERTGCRVLLALKGFAMWKLAPLISRYLDGICASGPYEARLGREEFGGEVHTFSAAFSETDLREALQYSNEVDFNSFGQWNRFRHLVPESVRCGLRINPECSTQDGHAIYDPCAPKSRLGIRRADFEGQSLDGISGFHFHTLCEQNADDLEKTLAAVEDKFGEFLPQMDWVNFGGGHHVTRADYDIDLLCRLITDFKEKYGVQVYLEPGEAVALNAGVLVAEILDIIENDGPIALLNVSCTAHMPDVLEMPYRPNLFVYEGDLFDGDRAGLPGEKPFTFRLAGPTCLAGDVIGDYSFDRPLEIGDRLVFEDMGHYTMVKTTMFNGVKHPAIAVRRGAEIETVREFSYEDYKGRLS